MSRPQKPYTPKTDIAMRLGEFFSEKKFSEIAKMCSISQSMAGAVMKGETEAPVEVLRYIAEHGGDVNWILTGKRKGGECVGGGDNPTLRVAMANWNDMEGADQMATAAKVQAKAERARAKKADDAKSGADDPVVAKSFWTNKPHVRSVKPWTFGREVALTAVLALGGFFVVPYAVVVVAPLWLFLAYALTMRRFYFYAITRGRKGGDALFVVALFLGCFLISYILSALTRPSPLIFVGVSWLVVLSCIPDFIKWCWEQFGGGLISEQRASSRFRDPLPPAAPADFQKALTEIWPNLTATERFKIWGGAKECDVWDNLAKVEGLLADVAEKWRTLGGEEGRVEVTEWQTNVASAIMDTTLSLASVAYVVCDKATLADVKRGPAWKAVKRAMTWMPTQPERRLDEPEENDPEANHVDVDYNLFRAWVLLREVVPVLKEWGEKTNETADDVGDILWRVAGACWRVERMAKWNRMTAEERAERDSIFLTPVGILLMKETYPRKGERK